jgi:hypothetical protein
MKKVFYVVILVMSLVLFFSCIKGKTNNDETYNGFGYEQYISKSAKNGYIITYYEGESKEIVIPSEIKGKPVVAIGENFRWDDLNSITLPANVEFSIKSGNTSIFYLYEKNGRKEKTYNVSYTTTNDYEIAIIDNSVVEIINYLGEGIITESKKILTSLSTLLGKEYTSTTITISLDIPATINDLPVLVLRRGAFSKGSDYYLSEFATTKRGTKKPVLDSVTIPDTVKFIEEGVFYNNNLNEINLPNSLVFIGGRAFYENSLTGVILPNSLEIIGYEAFAENKLTSVVIPNSVKIIGEFAFYNNMLTSVIISDSVDIIHPYAFARNLLTSVIIPDSITKFEYGAFADNKLIEVIIPPSVVTIENSAFSGNELTNIYIPDSVKKIGDNAFSFNHLTNITLPENVEIDPSSFYAFLYDHYVNNQRKKATYKISFSTVGEFEIAILNDSVVEIYRHISPNQDVNIPDTIMGLPVVSIGNYAFSNGNFFMGTIWSNIPYKEGQPEMTEFDISNPNVGSSILGVMGTKTDEDKEHIARTLDFMIEQKSKENKGIFPDNNLTNVKIPNTVKIIGREAFAYNRLTNVYIPKSVKYVADGAFIRNNSLQISIPASVKYQETAFGDFMSGNKKIKKRYF